MADDVKVLMKSTIGTIPCSEVTLKLTMGNEEEANNLWHVKNAGKLFFYCRPKLGNLLPAGKTLLNCHVRSGNHQSKLII